MSLAPWKSSARLQREYALAPWEHFEAVYKECVTEPFKQADAALRDKVQSVETGIKVACEDSLREYFAELAAAEHVEWLEYERAGILVDMASAKAKTPKRLREQIAAFVTGVARGVEVISSMEDAEEIMVEFRRCLDAAQAIGIVRTATSGWRPSERPRRSARPPWRPSGRPSSVWRPWHRLRCSSRRSSAWRSRRKRSTAVPLRFRPRSRSSRS